MAWQRVKIEIPDDLKPGEREDIAWLVLEHIRDRTATGRGLNADGSRLKRFPGYSESYKKSLDFKIGRKSSTVNLTLSGDMLDAMDLLSHKKGQLVIGFENGSVDNDKAEGNILGAYGGDPNPGKARNFLGVTDAELKTILRKYNA